MRARDRRTDRVVALKQLQSLAPEARMRFEREMRITARLQHPGVVPVHETGRFASGEPFYAMKLVQGRSLKQVIAETKTLDERLALLSHVLAVAETVAYAHSQRIIHRDLKPSNVIVGAYGETVVIDWGLAKDLDAPSEGADAETAPYRTTHGEGEKTMAGQVLGTPAYMAPEQARGEDVDERADVYAIGAVLYHLLAGEPPYRGSSSREVLAAVSKGPPVPLSSRDRSAPADLVAIVQKAMDRDPSRRYGTAKLMAEDLRRFQTGQLVGAHRYSVPSLLSRWLSRHRAISLLGLASLVALVTLGVTSYQRIQRERDGALAERTRAEKALALAKRRAGELVLSQARSLLDRDPTRVIGVLRTYDGEDWGAVRIVAAQAVARGVARRTIEGSPSHVFDLSMVDDGRNYVYIDSAGEIFEGAVESGRPVRIAQGSEDSFDLTRDGNEVLYASQGSLRVFDRTKRKVVIVGIHPSKISALVIDPSGNWAGSTSLDGAIRIWHFKEQHPSMRVLSGHLAAVFWLAASPDGLSLASTSIDGTARLWNLATGRSIVLGACSSESRINFSPDGRYVVWSSPEGNIKLMNVLSEKLLTIPGTSELAGPFAFSRDGTLLAAASADLQVGVWALDSGMKIYGARSRSRVYALRFSDSAGQFAWADNDAVHVVGLTTGLDRSYSGNGSVIALDLLGHTMVIAADAGLRVWEIDEHDRHWLHRHRTMASRLAVSVDGRFVASSGLDQKVLVTDTRSGDVLSLNASSTYMGSLAFDSIGVHLLVSSWDGNVYLWDLPTQKRSILQGHSAAVESVAFGIGDIPISADAKGQIILWNKDGNPGRRFTGYTAGIWPLVVAPDGRLITGDDTGSVRAWLPGEGTDVLLGKHEADITSLSLSSRGVVAVGGGDNAQISLFSTLAGGHVIRHIGPPRGRQPRLSFSADARYLAVSSHDDMLLVHDLEAGTTRSLNLGVALMGVSFAKPANVVVASTSDGMLLAWDISTDAQDLVLVDEDKGPIQDLKTSPDGKQAYFVLPNGKVGSWDINFRHPVPVRSSEIPSWLAGITEAATVASADGSPVAH